VVCVARPILHRDAACQCSVDKDNFIKQPLLPFVKFLSLPLKFDSDLATCCVLCCGPSTIMIHDPLSRFSDPCYGESDRRPENYRFGNHGPSSLQKIYKTLAQRLNIYPKMQKFRNHGFRVLLICELITPTSRSDPTNLL